MYNLAIGTFLIRTDLLILLFKEELERRCRLNKSIDSLDPIENIK